MRKVETVVISGVSYHLQQLGAKEGRAVLARLIKMGSAFAADDEAVAVKQFADSLTEENLAYFCEAFAKVTAFTPEGQPDTTRLLLKDQFDDHFAGAYGAMVKWLWASIKCNFASFLGELQGGEGMPSLLQNLVPRKANP
jgi:hypothetical protein